MKAQEVFIMNILVVEDEVCNAEVIKGRIEGLMGYELIPQCKELCPDIGIVTMTNHKSRELEWKTRQQGIVYYMIKPFSIKAMKEILDHISKKRERS